MRKLLLATASALLLLGAAETASAAVAQPFLRLPNEKQQDMNAAADMVEKAIARKADGTDPVSPELCRTNGSCITPAEIHRSIKEKHPEVGLGDLSDLPRYMRTLIKDEKPKPGIRNVGRVMVEGNIRRLDWTMKREPLSNEVIFVDPNTGTEIFMGFCFNVIELNVVDEVTVEAEPCVVARVPANQKSYAYRHMIFGPAPLPEGSVARCLAYRLPGETEWRRTWPDECPWGEVKFADGTLANRCDTRDIRAFVRARMTTVSADHELRGGIMLDNKFGQGYIEVRLPPELARQDGRYTYAGCMEEREAVPGNTYPVVRNSTSQLTTYDDFVPAGRSDNMKQAQFNVWRIHNTNVAATSP